MQCYSLLFHRAHEREVQELDLAQRALPWIRHTDTLSLVCDLPPNRGTVALTKYGWFWQGCIKQPDRFKHTSAYFADLEKALAWAEQELVKIQEITKVQAPLFLTSECDMKSFNRLSQRRKPP